jgi:hypothetical protein
MRAEFGAVTGAPAVMPRRVCPPRRRRSGTGRLGRSHVHRRCAGPNPVPAATTGQLAQGPTPRIRDRGEVLRHRVRPQHGREPRYRQRPRAVRHPHPTGRQHCRPPRRGQAPRPTLRRRRLRVDRTYRPGHLVQHQNRVRVGAGGCCAARRRRGHRCRLDSEPERRQLAISAGHADADPARQAGHRRVVRAEHAGAVLGRIEGSHRPGLQHRQTALRIFGGEAAAPGQGQSPCGQDQASPGTRPGPRSRGDPDLPVAGSAPPRLRRDRHPAQPRPRAVPAARPDPGRRPTTHRRLDQLYRTSDVYAAPSRPGTTVRCRLPG